MRASSRLPSIASLLDCRLVPLPEINTAMGTWRAINILRPNRRLPGAGANFADNKAFLPDVFERPQNAVGMPRADYKNHTDTVVEGSIHFALLDGADLLDQAEDWRHRPTAALDHRASSFWQNSR